MNNYNSQLTNPLVSILVPVYNVEEYIEQCACSIFEQTYNNIEFIFVDDGSTDCSLGILQNVIQKYPERQDQVKILKHSRNRGNGAARKTGVLAAHGEYVQFVDSDDYIAPNMTERLVSVMIKEQSDMVVCNYNTVYENHVVCEKITEQHHLEHLSCMRLSLIGLGFYCYLWNKLFKRSIFVENGTFAPEGVTMFEDLCMMYQVYYFASSIYLIPDALYYYRYNKSSTIHSYTKKIQKTQPIFVDIVKQMNDFFFRHQIKQKELIESENEYKLTVLILIALYGNPNFLNQHKSLFSDITVRKILASKGRPWYINLLALSWKMGCPPMLHFLRWVSRRRKSA